MSFILNFETYYYETKVFHKTCLMIHMFNSSTYPF